MIILLILLTLIILLIHTSYLSIQCRLFKSFSSCCFGILGLPADWYVGFPFTVAPHPQYMGVCMSVIGVNAFAATDRHVKAGWFNLTTIQVLYYVYMGLVEDYL